MTLSLYLGVDVSKKTLAAALLDQNDKTLWTSKSLPNSTAGFAKLMECVTRVAAKKSTDGDYVVEAGMEATGVYGEQLAYYMNDNNDRGRIRTYILNPASVKAYGETVLAPNKNDAADAKLIASYMSMSVPKGQISPWKAPSPEERELRELSRRRDELMYLRIEELNRREKLRHMNKVPHALLDDINSHINYLDEAISSMEKAINEHIDNEPKQKEDIGLLKSIPGIGDVNSVTLKSEMIDIERFESAKNLVSFVGIAPREHSSGTSVHRRPRISRRGNARIRHHLFMAALVAIRVNPAIKEFYDRLLKRKKSKKQAIVASMRKLLNIIWAVLKNRKAFAPQYALQLA